jgi:anti-anti-sigma factor
MLVAEGRLVLGDGADWEAWSPQAAATPGRIVRVDLSAVTDIDAAGVGLLVRLAVQARCHGRRLAVVAASPRVRRVLELVQLDRVAGVGTGRISGRRVR